MNRFGSAVVVGMVTLLILGCQSKQREEPWQPREEVKDYGRPLPPGKLALRKISPEDYPDFSRAYYDRNGLEAAINHSLDYMSRKSSKRYYPYGEISHERATASMRAFLEVLHATRSPEEFDREICQRFDVYQSVGWDGRGTVYFTGYYTPIFEARKTRDATFRYPLYRLPSDLVKDAEGQTLGRRTGDGGLVAYPSRREIEEGNLLAGQEIAWLKDPFETYIVSVQGSAKLRLADGSLWELGYAGTNGHDYVPVGKILIEDGALDRNSLSLQAMMRFFAANPDKIAEYCRQNPRFTFFQETKGGPFGSINVPVTPYRTLATDKKVFPRACLTFIDTELPVRQGSSVAVVPHASFVLDQDTGGAIRAAGKSDLYLGTGIEAEALAGRTGAEGALYYLFVRE